MQELINFVHEFGGECSNERRIEILMLFYYVSRGSLHAMLSALDNEPQGTEVRRVAQDNLEALHGFLTERLGK